VVDVLAAEAPGDHATTPTRTAARTVAAAVRVALVPGAGDSGTGGALGAGSESSAEGALVVLAVSRDTAAALAQAAATSRLTVAIRAG
jgi:Flp pilus assembly protein CpaB